MKVAVITMLPSSSISNEDVYQVFWDPSIMTSSSQSIFISTSSKLQAHSMLLGTSTLNIASTLCLLHQSSLSPRNTNTKTSLACHSSFMLCVRLPISSGCDQLYLIHTSSVKIKLCCSHKAGRPELNWLAGSSGKCRARKSCYPFRGTPQ